MMNSKQRIFKAASMGLIALDILSNDQDAQVFGKTSKGVYIKTSGKWLVFLSFDQFRGPLTITLDEVSPILEQASIGKPVYISSQSLYLPDLDLIITLRGGEVWWPQLASTPLLYNRECHEKLVRITNEVMSKERGISLGIFLPPLLGLPHMHSAPRIIGNINWIDIQQLQNYIRNGEADPLVRMLTEWLGSGLGLTPSADDFAMGLILTLNRWPNSNWTTSGLCDLNLQVVEAAYAKTTSLSANLIECAALGLADERLINALDWLVTGVAREPELVNHLLGWGSSSGVDAFAGMAVALTASPVIQS